MSEKRFQVFLSSTYRDLVSERDRLLRELARFNYIAAGMEYFPAIDEEQFQYIKRIIDDSDFYVVVAAGKYGTIAPDGISYSEKEYDYAVDQGIPVIALLYRDARTLPKAKREIDPAIIVKLEAFRKKLEAGRLVKPWGDETELCLALVQSLAESTKLYNRPGWVRGNELNAEDLLRKIVELEEENRVLQNVTKAPAIEHIKRQLDGELGSGLIKSTIPKQLRGRQRRGSFAPACRSGLRCA